MTAASPLQEAERLLRALLKAVGITILVTPNSAEEISLGDEVILEYCQDDEGGNPTPWTVSWLHYDGGGWEEPPSWEGRDPEEHSSLRSACRAAVELLISRRLGAQVEWEGTRRMLAEEGDAQYAAELAEEPPYEVPFQDEEPENEV